jgi:hypothetical protein
MASNAQINCNCCVFRNHFQKHKLHSSPTQGHKRGNPYEINHCKIRTESHRSGSNAVRPLGTSQFVAVHVVVLTWHQHCKCRLAHICPGIQCLLSTSSVGGASLPTRHHHADRQRRTTWRCHRPPTSDVDRHLPVYGGISTLRHRSNAMVVDCRASDAGLGRGHHDGTHDCDGGRGCTKRKDR